MKRISIVVLHFKGNRDTSECLSSLQKINVGNDHVSIIAVDNGSSERLRFDDFSRLKGKILRSESNLGFTGGNNLGISSALNEGADYVLLLNNDTLVDKDFLLELLRESESDKKIGVLSPKIYFVSGYEYHRDRYTKNELGKVIWYAGGIMDWKNVIGHHKGIDEVDSGQYDKVEETDYASGCCLLIKREVLQKAGMFDNKYFLYYEDADLSLRAKKNNYKIVYVPSSVVWHKNAGSAGGSGSSLQDYYISRNRLLFGMRYAPYRSKIALARESFTLLTQGRTWQKKGVLDYYLRKFGRGSFNT